MRPISHREKPLPVAYSSSRSLGCQPFSKRVARGRALATATLSGFSTISVSFLSCIGIGIGLGVERVPLGVVALSFKGLRRALSRADLNVTNSFSFVRR